MNHPGCLQFLGKDNLSDVEGTWVASELKIITALYMHIRYSLTQGSVLYLHCIAAILRHSSMS